MTQQAHALPKHLPRFAESFRVFVDRRPYDRLITGEWASSALWAKVSQDDCPLLATLGTVGAIASTTPTGYHYPGGLLAWYGDADYPAIYWHLKDGEWQSPADEWCERFTARNGISLGLFKLPLDVTHVPHHLRKYG